LLAFIGRLFYIDETNKERIAMDKQITATVRLPESWIKTLMGDKKSPTEPRESVLYRIIGEEVKRIEKRKETK